MSKKFFLLILGFFLIILSGCSQVPNEVLQDMDSYRSEKSKNVNSNFKFEYINSYKIYENVEKVAEKNYNQFTLSDNISFNLPSEIKKATFRYTQNFEKNYKDVLKLFFTQQELNSQTIELSADHANSYSYSFYNEDDKMYGCVSDNGFIAMLRPDAFDISFAYSGENVKIYHVDRNEDLSDIYELKNGKCSVLDAVNFVNEWLTTKYKTISKDYDYKVKTVIVRRHKEHFLFEITIENFYNDIPLDSLAMNAETDEKTNRMYIKHVTNCIKIQMVNAFSIDSFTNGTGILMPINSEKVDKIISLESALDFCENTFTDFKDITISDISIKYVLTPIYDYIGEEYLDESGNITIITQSAYSAGIMVESRPVWEFIIDVDPSEYLQEDEVNTYGCIQKYIYIDMVTGELFYQMDTVLQGTG